MSQVRIIGFGLGCVHKSPLYINATRSRYGGRLYWSPERAQGRPYDYKDDIWGLGCIGASLITLKPLESRVSGHCDFALQGDLVNALKAEVLRNAPENLGQVVIDCLQEDPAKRPTATSVEYRLRDSQSLWEQIDLSNLPRVSWWIDPYIKHVVQKLVVEKECTDKPVLEAVCLLLDGDASSARATLATHHGADALVVISVAFTCDKMFDDALRSARCALDNQGSNAAFWLWLSALLRLVDASDTEQEKAITKCLELDPSDSMVRFTNGRFLHAVRKDNASAEREFLQAIEAAPNNSVAHNGYGRLLYDVREDYDGAEREYKRAIEADPNYSQAHSNYGWLLQDVRKDYEGAEREYKLAIEADPNNSNAHNNYGILLHDVHKDYASAEVEYKLAIAADPNYSYAHYNYGILLDEVRKDYAGAEHEYKLATTADPNNSYAHCSYGTLLKRAQGLRRRGARV